MYRRVWILLAALVLLGAGGAGAGLVQESLQRPAVILVAGGPGGQKELAPLVTALEVGGYRVLSLAPSSVGGGIEALARRIGKAAVALAGKKGGGRVALVAHGAGGLAAALSLQAGHIPALDRVLFLGLPREGLRLPPGGGVCRDMWRQRVALFYGERMLQEAAPGSPAVRALARGGVPLDMLVGSISGRLDQKVADSMVNRAACGRELAGLGGDGVVKSGSVAGLAGFGRDDRDYLVLGDHLDLPARQRVRDLVMSFLKLKAASGSVAVVLVIDASGSVRSVDKLGMRQEALRLLISRLVPGDQVGVVSFNTRARTILPLSQIRSPEQARRVAGSVRPLPAKGDTNIGAGLDRAGRLLQGARTGVKKVVVLLTDGRNDPEAANRPTLETVRRLARQGVTLYTVGLTDRVDELFLARLAREGGGAYLAAPSADELVAVFDRIQARIDGRTLLASRRGKVPGRVEILVDSTIRRLDISLMGAGSGLDLRLVSPGGSRPRVHRARGRSYATYTIQQPAVGPWRLEVVGPRGRPFQLQAAATTSLSARLAPVKNPPRVGLPWDFALDVRQEDLALDRVQARVEIRAPGGTVYHLELKPTPSTGFSVGRSSAGTLSGRFAGFKQAGDAFLRAVVSGRNRQGEPFRRLVRATVHVSDEKERRGLRRILGESLVGGRGGRP